MPKPKSHVCSVMLGAVLSAVHGAALIGYGIYRYTDLKTTEDVYLLASTYSHEIGYAILIIVAAVIGVLIYKGLKK